MNLFHLMIVLMTVLHFGTFVAVASPCTRALSTGDGVSDLEVRDGVAFVAADYDGLSIIDMNDPDHLILLSRIQPARFAIVRVVVEGHFAFLADAFHGIVCFDVSNPSNPVEVGLFPIDTFIGDIRVRDGILYAIGPLQDSDGSGLLCIDVRVPSSPSFLGEIEFSGAVSDLDLMEGHVIVTNWNNGVHLVNVDDPANPYIHSTVERVSGNGYSESALYGDHLFIAQSSGGVHSYDVSDPGLPVYLGSDLRSPGFDAIDITVRDQFLVVSEFSSHWRLEFIDIREPAAPELLWTYEGTVLGSIEQVLFDETYAYFGTSEQNVADVPPGTYLGEDGLSVLDFAFLLQGQIDCSLCVADLNFDGFANFFDVSVFLSSYLGNYSNADLNSDGTLNFFDVSAFLVAFAKGCP